VNQDPIGNLALPSSVLCIQTQRCASRHSGSALEETRAFSSLGPLNSLSNLWVAAPANRRYRDMRICFHGTKEDAASAARVSMTDTTKTLVRHTVRRSRYRPVDALIRTYLNNLLQPQSDSDAFRSVCKSGNIGYLRSTQKKGHHRPSESVLQSLLCGVRLANEAERFLSPREHPPLGLEEDPIVGERLSSTGPALSAHKIVGSMRVLASCNSPST